MYSIPNESKCKAVFLSINSETQCVSLLFLSSRFSYDINNLMQIVCWKSVIKSRLIFEIISDFNIA